MIQLPFATGVITKLPPVQVAVATLGVLDVAEIVPSAGNNSSVALYVASLLAESK